MCFKVGSGNVNGIENNSGLDFDNSETARPVHKPQSSDMVTLGGRRIYHNYSYMEPFGKSRILRMTCLPLWSLRENLRLYVDQKYNIMAFGALFGRFWTNILHTMGASLQTGPTWSCLEPQTVLSVASPLLQPLVAGLCIKYKNFQ